MAVEASPYSPDYINNWVGSAVGGELGYNATPTPLIAPSAGVAAGNVQTPFHDGVVLDASTAPDPNANALAQQRAAQSAAFGAQKTGILSSASDAAANGGLGLKSGILDFIDSLKQGQNTINTNAVNNELGKKQGMTSIMDMISNGLRSGGVMLANKNASNSSGAEALARAYALLGRQQASGVGNKYEIANNNLASQQENLNTSKATYGRKYEEGKTQLVNNIVSSAAQQLSALDAQIAGASLPDRIAIETEKENIRQNALSQLAQYDNLLTTEAAQVNPQDKATNIQKAQELSVAGTSAPTDYNYTTDMPGALQGTGPLSSNLPIFTFNSKRKVA